MNADSRNTVGHVTAPVEESKDSPPSCASSSHATPHSAAVYGGKVDLCESDEENHIPSDSEALFFRACE